MLVREQAVRGIRQFSSAIRRQPGGESGRDGRCDRTQRRGKDHAAARHLPADRSQRRGDPMEGKLLNHVPSHEAHRPRHRARTGEPTAVSAADRRGQSSHGRLLPSARAQIRGASRARVSTLPAHAGAPAASGGHAVGRRAADVRHRPRAHVGAKVAAARRTLRRPRTGDGAIDLRGSEDR